jgi:predicted DCC family thiol-disulfide oxidoreductase YuxK
MKTLFKKECRNLIRRVGKNRWMPERDGVKIAGEKPDRVWIAAARTNQKAMTPWPDDDVILYDGICVFCSRWIRFVAARDRERRFRFTAIQSVYGTRLAQAFGINPQDPDTNAVIRGGVARLKSDGALTVLSSLPGWNWTRLFLAIPRPLRDAVYNFIARNRYRIFGRYEACFVPDAEFRDRVME